MAEIANPNIPTYQDNAADVTARDAEVPTYIDGQTANPFEDSNGDGTYNSYLGCNRAGSCASGIGICSGVINTDTAEQWTVLDQNEAARVPQDSDYIGNTGFVDRSSVAWPSSGGDIGNPTNPITHIQYPASAPGTVDVNDTANYLAATQQAAPGAVVDVGSGAINATDQTVEIGDVGWFPVPVA